MNCVVFLAIVAAFPGTSFPDVKPDEKIIFFPTEAWRVNDGRAWEIHIHGWIFEIEWRRHLLGPLYDAMDFKEDARDDENEGVDQRHGAGENETRRELFIERAAPFLVDNQRGKRVQIKVGTSTFTLPPSASDGHFEGTVHLATEAVDALRNGGELPDDWLSYRAVLPKGDNRVFEGRVHLIDDVGISVVSDIDDTVKITHVRDHKDLLRHTFLLPFESVAGMSELYTAWSHRPDVVFHYVSSSPWQLFEPLRDLLRPPRFPEGTFHLRRFRLKGLKLFESLKFNSDHKTPVLAELFARYPDRRFVLIGDAFERDPEIYSRLALDHPHQVRRIFIRDVDRDETSPRYRTLFAPLPPGTAVIFREPRQLVDLLPAPLATSRPAAAPAAKKTPDKD